MTQTKYKKALISWSIMGVFVAIVLISIYIVALIIPDTITPNMAEKIGYGMIALIIILVLIGMYLMAVSEAEKQELVIQHEVDSRVIEDLEKELKRIEAK